MTHFFKMSVIQFHFSLVVCVGGVLNLISPTVLNYDSPIFSYSM